MQVAIVVETPCRDLEALAKSMPVWAIDTPENRSIAKPIWEKSAPHNAEQGLTLFDINDPTDREGNCISPIDWVELHHPEITSLLLVGVSVTPALTSQLAECGYTLESTEGMLVARRNPAHPFRLF